MSVALRDALVRMAMTTENPVASLTQMQLKDLNAARRDARRDLDYYAGTVAMAELCGEAIPESATLTEVLRAARNNLRDHRKLYRALRAAIWTKQHTEEPTEGEKK